MSSETPQEADSLPAGSRLFINARIDDGDFQARHSVK